MGGINERLACSEWGTAGCSAGEEPNESPPESGETMPVIDETVVIARPAGEVFDFLMLAENLPRWDSPLID
jgi:hypothetical protein